jgi:hypothetical protein
LDLFRKYWLTLLVLAPLTFVALRAEASLQDIQTVFIILEENQSWSSIRGNASAPYINHGLIPIASHAEQYFTPPGNHPSLPNYLWLEAGSNFGITVDEDPSAGHQSTTNHLVTLLNNAGISWTSYQEDITGSVCPLTAVNQYAPKHNPMVYFDDVTNTNNSSSAYCIANVRPFSEFAGDLQSNVITRYNFITPNLCDDMHGGTGCPSGSALITQGDTWLSNRVSTILSSQAYSNGGAIFIVWDEGTSSSDGPIGMIVLSRLARGGGYSNTVHYTHSSTLRTMQEIFNVAPFLRGATNATDLSDLFNPFPGIINITPGCGGLSGGTAITISGSNFVSGAIVTVGGIPASNVVYVTTSTLTAATPAGSAGAKNVVVTNPDTQTATVLNGFTYVVPPSFGGLTGVTAAVESATLTWAAATGTGPMTYKVFQATTPGAENFASPVAQVSAPPVFIASLDPGSTNPITYYFVCRASDACGNSESNSVELSVQPLLDPNKSQVGDGIPNGWKQQYGFNPFDPTVANADPDRDGFTNLQEYQAGTDPTDISSSPFRITDVHLEGNDVRIAWLPGTGMTNALQSTAGTADGSYQTNNFTDIFIVTNTLGTVTNYLDLGAATNFPARYYRVRLVP